MLKYQHKLRIFRLVRNFFKFFNFQLFYSKKQNYLKGIKVDTVIDVGVGNGTKELLNNFPNSFFYLIEPNPKFWKKIENKILTNYKGKLFKIAAGSKHGEEDFYDHDLTSSFLQRSDYQLTKMINVEIDLLDNIIPTEKLKKTLLKIDTEGYELEVLKGSKKLLKKVDYCIVEVRLQKINTYNPSELICFLNEYNFQFYRILKIYYVKDGINWMDILFKKNQFNIGDT